MQKQHCQTMASLEIDCRSAGAALQSTRCETSIASSGDPEVVADQYADANYVTDNYSDVYVEQADWEMLYGGTISQDISGDGSVIATVQLDPISTANPSAKLHLLLNGVEVANRDYSHCAASHPEY